MKKYKDEVQRIQLRDEDKQKLKEAIYQNRSSPNISKKTLCYASAIVFCLFCIVFTISSFIKYNQPSNTTNVPDNLATTNYIPQWYEVYGGMGIQERTANMKDFETIKESQFDKTEDKIIQEITYLPVYEYERVKTLKEEFDRYDDAVYLQSITNIANTLSIMEAPQIGVHENVYFIESTNTKINIKENGKIVLLTKEIIDAEIKDSPNEVLELAKKYFEFYQVATDIADPVYHIEFNQSGYNVVISENEETEIIDNYVIFSIQNDYIETTDGIRLVYLPSITIPDKIHVKQITKLPIMSIDIAQNILLHGGYYSSAREQSPILVEDIIGWELLYSDESFLNFLPYRVPIYRFFVRNGEAIDALDVIAIEQDSLKSLDKVTWYIEK